MSFQSFLTGRFVLLLCLVLIVGAPLRAQDQGNFAKSMKKYRKTYRKELCQNPRAPISCADAKKLDYFPPDEQYLVQCRVVMTPHAEPFDMATSSGEMRTYRRYAWLHFALHGDSLRLAIYHRPDMGHIPMYKDYLFLPFRDLTNGAETYGGGRYLELSLSDIDGGKMWIDFNKAFNPWCVYSEGYSCPIPPSENDLDLRIAAGEMDYRGEKRKRE